MKNIKPKKIKEQKTKSKNNNYNSFSFNKLKVLSIISVFALISLLLILPLTSADLVFNSKTGNIDFNTSSKTRMRITSGGLVGINTTSPSQELVVVGIGNFTNELYIAGQKACRQDGTNCPGGASGQANQWVNDSYQLRIANDFPKYVNVSNVLFVNDSSGNMGIGTTSPDTKLHILAPTTGFQDVLILQAAANGADSALIAFNNQGATLARIGTLSATDRFWINSGKEISFGTNNSTFRSNERMRITTSGKVGIGTTTPSEALNVSGNIGATGNITADYYFGSGKYLSDIQAGSVEDIWVNESGDTMTGRLNIAKGSGDLMLNASDVLYVNGTSGNVGIGTTSPGQKLDISGGIARENGYNLAEAATDNMLVNGDFEMASIYGWSGFSGVVSGTNAYNGNYTAQRTGPATILSDDYIPIDPVRDVIQLEGYFKKAVDGTTPGLLYFGYKAYDKDKNVITTAPCGSYCYFAASGYDLPADGNWHKFSATTTGEGTSYPNFPVGTEFVRVLVLINYQSSADAVTYMDHVTVKRINHGPLFVGNNFPSTNMVDQHQVSKIYTTSSNDLILEPSGNVGIGTTNPQNKLEVAGTINASAIKVGTTDVCQSDGTNCLGGASEQANQWANDSYQLRIANSFPKYVNVSNVLFVNDSSGNVGIGTTGPWEKLHIANDDNATLLIQETTGGLNDGANLEFICGTTDTPDAKIRAETVASGDIDMMFYTTTSGGATLDEQMRIMHNGKVGIGTSTPSEKLSVVGNSLFDGNINTTGSVYSSNIYSIGSSGLYLNYDNSNIDISTKFGTPTAGEYKNLTLDNYDNNANRFNDLGKTFFFDDDLFIDGRIRTSGDAYIDGNVGIGTTGPNTKLDINLGAVNGNEGINENQGIKVGGDARTNVGYVGYVLDLDTSTANTSGFIRMARTSGTAYLGMEIGSQSRDGIRFVTDTSTFPPTSEKMRITTTGKVGIGTTSPAQKLTVVGNISASDSINATKLCIGTDCRSSWSSLGNVSGDGTTNYIPKWTGQNTLGNSIIQDTGNVSIDSGTLFVNANLDRVGIGTTGPLGLFELVGNNPNIGFFDNNGGTDRFLLRATNDLLQVVIDTNNDGTNNINSMTWDSTGNVGIGTSSPNTKLDIHGTGSQALLNITDGSSNVMYIDNTGNVGIGTTSPSQKLSVVGNSLFDGNINGNVSDKRPHEISGLIGDLTGYGQRGVPYIVPGAFDRLLFLDKKGGSITSDYAPHSGELSRMVDGTGKYPYFDASDVPITINFTLESAYSGCRDFFIYFYPGYAPSEFTVEFYNASDYLLGSDHQTDWPASQGVYVWSGSHNDLYTTKQIKLILQAPKSGYSYIHVFEVSWTNYQLAPFDAYLDRGAGGTVWGGVNLAVDNGNVGIGTASPTQKLDVAGNINITSSGNLTVGGNYIKDSGSSKRIQFDDSNGDVIIHLGT